MEDSFVCPTSIPAFCVDFKHHTGPHGYRMKPPLSRLRTLYSYYRQWFMTKIHVFRVVLLVRCQFKRCVSISNTTLGPSGHDSKPPPSWRLGTFYSHCRQWFMTEIIILRLVLFVRRQFKRWGRFQTPHWTPVVMVRSRYRRGRGLCTAIIGNCL